MINKHLVSLMLLGTCIIINTLGLIAKVSSASVFLEVVFIVVFVALLYINFIKK